MIPYIIESVNNIEFMNRLIMYIVNTPATILMIIMLDFALLLSTGLVSAMGFHRKPRCLTSVMFHFGFMLCGTIAVGIDIIDKMQIILIDQIVIGLHGGGVVTEPIQQGIFKFGFAIVTVAMFMYYKNTPKKYSSKS